MALVIQARYRGVGAGIAVPIEHGVGIVPIVLERRDHGPRFKRFAAARTNNVAGVAVFGTGRIRLILQDAVMLVHHDLVKRQAVGVCPGKRRGAGVAVKNRVGWRLRRAETDLAFRIQKIQIRNTVAVSERESADLCYRLRKRNGRKRRAFFKSGAFNDGHPRGELDVREITAGVERAGTEALQSCR